MPLILRYNTDPAWVDAVLDDFDLFLIDHAHAEKKASGMAMSMLCHYPDKPDIVKAMADLAIEELAHFREVIKLMQARQLQLSPDEKDPYVNTLRKQLRKGKEEYLLDRLLVGAIIEARGCERFGLIGQHHNNPDLKNFYQAIAASEEKHHELFTDLAVPYFSQDIIDERLNSLLDIEAEITAALPIRSALH